ERVKLRVGKAGAVGAGRGEVFAVEEEKEVGGVGVVRVPAGAGVHLVEAALLAVLKACPGVFLDFALDAELLDLRFVKLRTTAGGRVGRNDVELEDERAAGGGVDGVGVAGFGEEFLGSFQIKDAVRVAEAGIVTDEARR